MILWNSFSFYLLFLFSNILCLSAADETEFPIKGSGPRRRIRYRSHSLNRTTPIPDHEVEEIEEDSTDNNSVLSLLHKMNDRLSTLSVLNNQQMRRFETLEYRLTKLEVQIQEKTDVSRSDLKEVARRVQQIDWQSSKTDSTLDSLKSDTSFLKQAIEHLRFSSVPVGPTIEGGNELDLNNKLQMVIGRTQTLLNGINDLQTGIAVLKEDISKISNSSSQLHTSIPTFLTTKHFQQTVADFKHHQNNPMCAVPSTFNQVNSELDSLPRDCSEVEGNKSSIYRIKPHGVPAPFFVYCDLQTQGGGWTVIQRRTEGTVEFYRAWHDYKHGFGNIGGEFWLGLEKIHALTNYKVNEIYIELEDFSLAKSYAHYSAFAVGSEVEGYPMSFLGTYEGNAGDSLLYHAGQKFSTSDVDQDNWAEGNCAQSHNGAWWYNACDTSNLNGRYLNGDLPDMYEYQGMYWYEFRGPKYSLKESKIMVRPVRDNNKSPRVGDVVHDYINILNGEGEH